MPAADMDHSHTMKNPGQQINAQLVAATFRNSFTAKLFFTLEIRNCYESYAQCNIYGKQQARKLQDAQAEKLTSLQAEKLTC